MRATVYYRRNGVYDKHSSKKLKSSLTPHECLPILEAEAMVMGTLMAWEINAPITHSKLDQHVAALIAKGQGYPRNSVTATAAATATAAVQPDKAAPIAEAPTPGPRKPKPALPPEIHATPVEGMDYMAAVRAMCGDRK